MFEIEIRQADGNRTVLIEKPEVIFGRKNEKSEVDVDLNPDTTVSRVHARVWQTEAGIEIEDLGSSVGTVVNGDVLEDATVLRPTDVIQLGETVVRVLSKSSSKRGVRTSKVAAVSSGVDSDPESECCLEFEVMTEGKRKAVEVLRGEAFIGRVNDEHPIDVDLSGESTVSRVHARVWVEGGTCWIEDLNSMHGVKVNNRPIEDKTELGLTDEVQIGAAQLRVQMHRVAAKRKPAPRKQKQVSQKEKPVPTKLELPSDGLYPVWKSETICFLPSEARQSGNVKFNEPDTPKVGVVRMIDKMEHAAEFRINTVDQRKSIGYYRHLMELPSKLEETADLDEFCTFLVGHLVKIFPEAERASLWLCELVNRELVLEAHVPNFKPAVSPLLAQQAIANDTGFIWKQCDKEESMQRLPVHGGMYAPVRMGQQDIGLICVDSTKERMEYQPEDLSLLIAIAQFTAPYIRGLSGGQ